MSEPQTSSSGSTSGPRLPLFPAEVLVTLLITLMTPMFLSAAGGNIAFARLAAAETLESYCAETHADLITVAKIIAFGLATLSSLCLSMADDVPLIHILRLRNNANALDRSEHRNRLALTASRSLQATAPPSDAEPDLAIAGLTASAAGMQGRAAESLAGMDSAAARSPAPAAPEPPFVAEPEPATDDCDAEQHYLASWAASAAMIAAETAASSQAMPPQDRRSAALWANALNDAAKAFREGDQFPAPPPR